MKYKGIVFDLDGVLWDSSKVHEQAFLEVLESKKELIDSFSYSKIAGMQTSQVFKQLFPEADKFEIERLSMKKQQIASRSLKSAHNIVDRELEELVDFLEDSYKLAICTSSRRENLQIFLDKITFSSAFKFTLTSEDVVQAKPHPEIYIKVSTLLCLDQNEILVLEDSKQGIISASQSGCHVVHLCKDSCEISANDPCLSGIQVINNLSALKRILGSA